MLKWLFWLCLLLGCQAAVFAQSKFQPGYVVLPSGDTLRGEIEYGTAQERAQQVRMRVAGAQKAYLPNEARSYGYAKGAYYEARHLPGSAGAQVFMETLVRGEASLYLLVDNTQKQRFYFRKSQDAALSELISRDTVVERVVNGTLKNMKLHDTRYRTTLRQAFGDCETVQSRIDQTAFTESDLRRVFREYAACKATLTGAASAVVESTQPRTRVRLQVFAGAQRTQLDYRDNSSYLRGIVFVSRPKPLVGIGLLVHPARFSEKLSVLMQGYFTSVAAEETTVIPPSVTDVPAFSLTTRNVFSYEASYLRFAAPVRYALGSGWRVRPYLQAGPEISFQIKGHSRIESVQTSTLGGEKRFSGSAFGDLRKTMYGATVSVGLVSPSLGLGAELRYTHLDGISQAVALTAPPQMLSVLLSYTFGKQR